jgi:hypothetical protein
MEPVALPHQAADPEPRYVEFAKDQAEYQTLPALLFLDGKVLTEWQPTEEERERLLRGENVRLWVWLHGQRCPNCMTSLPRRLQPVALEVTQEDVP